MNRRRFIIAGIIAAVLFIFARFWNSIAKILGLRPIIVSPLEGNNGKGKKPKVKTTILREVMFYRKLDKKKVQCQTCFRNCVISPGNQGFCRVRENRDGKYYSIVYAKPSAVHVDPIEKEPSLHVLPSTEILCFGTVGCNFQCRHCHNWHLSQASPGDVPTWDWPPDMVVETARQRKIPTISFTYNEPTVFYEYVYDIAVLAKKRGLKILIHSNGSMNPEPLMRLLKYTDALTIDLKGFTSKAYENSSARLEPVLNTLKIIKKEGKWFEIVNLVVPTVNDDFGAIKKMCEWIKRELGIETPIHFTRFHPAYKLIRLSTTPVKVLDRAHKIARDVGLHYVTIGNVPGHVYNSTFCPKCGKKLIHRIHFQVLKNDMEKGKCKFCSHKIPGIWS